ncbi:MAG: adenylate/guanylate cyclase domain-containing protein [Elainellaceae cyanobacterium]
MESSLRLFRARLSWHVVLWIFASIVVVEAVILVPSYLRREREQLRNLETISFEVLSSLMQLPMDEGQQAASDSFSIQYLPQTVNADSVIRGGELYLPNGELISSFGETPSIAFTPELVNEMSRDRSPNGDRYDVSWPAAKMDGAYVLIVRHDSSAINADLRAFAWRVVGLVLIISIVVTLATMAALGIAVIAPILKLREDLLLAGDAISEEMAAPRFQTLQTQRKDELGDVMEAFHQMYGRIRQEITIRRQAELALRTEQEKAERLLLNILPQSIADKLKQNQQIVAERFESVTVLFADIVGFTEIAARISATELVGMLNQIFSAFDQLADQYGLEKIKTIGDAYMVVGGLPMPRTDHMTAIADMALAMCAEIQQFKTDLGEPFQLRIGISSGAIVAGVIGLKKFSYDLWGDVVNVASRMESHSKPGHIQVTETVYNHLKDQYCFQRRGLLAVKGRGEMVTYFLTGAIASPRD